MSTPEPKNIHLLIGPMFAGKTSFLLAQVDRLRRMKRSVVLIKWAEDSRAAMVRSRDGRQTTPDFCVHTLTSIAARPEVVAADVIAIDEGQFFDDLAKFCVAQAAGGKTIYVAALDAYAGGGLWPSVAATIPYATHIKKYCSVCPVHHTCAPMTGRLDGSAACGVLIGDAETYRAKCLLCVTENKMETEA